MIHGAQALLNWKKHKCCCQRIVSAHHNSHIMMWDNFENNLLDFPLRGVEGDSKYSTLIFYDFEVSSNLLCSFTPANITTTTKKDTVGVFLAPIWKNRQFGKKSKTRIVRIKLSVHKKNDAHSAVLLPPPFNCFFLNNATTQVMAKIKINILLCHRQLCFQNVLIQGSHCKKLTV